MSNKFDSARNLVRSTVQFGGIFAWNEKHSRHLLRPLGLDEHGELGPDWFDPGDTEAALGNALKQKWIVQIPATSSTWNDETKGFDSVTNQIYLVTMAGRLEIAKEEERNAIVERARQEAEKLIKSVQSPFRLMEGVGFVDIVSFKTDRKVLGLALAECLRQDWVSIAGSTFTISVTEKQISSEVPNTLIDQADGNEANKVAKTTRQPNLVRLLVKTLRDQGLTDLKIDAGREDLVVKAIEKVSTIEEKSRLALEILVSSETLDANTVVANETQALSRVTLGMTVITFFVLIANAVGAVCDVCSYNREGKNIDLKVREEKVLGREKAVEDKEKNVRQREMKANTREEQLLKQDLELRKREKMLKPQKTEANRGSLLRKTP